jgi:hypothetical protein
VVCETSIEDSQKEFAEDQSAHPGILGLIHTECYTYVADVVPDLPWTDPISGEVDFEGMEEDLGVSDGSEDFNPEVDGF